MPAPVLRTIPIHASQRPSGGFPWEVCRQAAAFVSLRFARSAACERWEFFFRVEKDDVVALPRWLTHEQSRPVSKRARSHAWHFLCSCPRHRREASYRKWSSSASRGDDDAGHAQVRGLSTLSASHRVARDEGSSRLRPLQTEKGLSPALLVALAFCRPHRSAVPGVVGAPLRTASQRGPS